MNRRGQSAKEAFVGIEGAFPRNTPPGVQQNSRRASQKARRLFRGSARSRIRRCSGAVSAGQTVRQPFSRLDVFAEMPASTCSRSGRERQDKHCAARVLRQRGSVQRTDTASGLGQNDARRVVVPWTRTQREQLCFTRGHGAQLQCHTPHAAHPADSSSRLLQAQRAGGAPRKKVCRTPGVVSNASRSTPQCET